MTEKQGVLFSAEEMNSIEKDNLWNQPTGPVTVLGMTFENDEERRKYFRDELRKLLPELRKIEGFPIGEDDDIINLSDPPYYTACPNPWLNDFIAEWEQQKEQLKAEGKRKSDFEVKEPYASDVSEGKNNPIYTAHSYHTKVPHPAIMRYLLHYTQPGDIVFDGFAGTGMTGVAAQMCAKPDIEVKNRIENEKLLHGQKKTNWGIRHAVLSDLSPVASFIAHNYNSQVNTQKFEMEAKKILAEVEKECGWMYETRHTNGSSGKINYMVWSDVFVCPNCGKDMVFYEVAVDKDNAKVKDDFSCPHCGAKHTKKSISRSLITLFDQASNKTIQQAKMVPVLIQYADAKGKRYEKKPDEKDLALIDKINNADIPYWYPTDLMMGKGEKWGDSWRAGYHLGITNVHHFYTKRALWVLALLRNKLGDNNKALNVFDSIDTFLSSKLVRYNQGKRGNGNLAGTLYVPSLIAESNVLNLFKGKLDDFVKAYKLLNGNNSVSINSATQIPMADNSVDYIFTDPPFGSNIMYSELNYIQESWLKVKTNNEEEAIENEAQHKGLNEYGGIMQRCFKEYFRVLKPERWMTVEFSNTSASVWNSIQNALIQSGFIVAIVSALDKQQGSYKAVTTTIAVKQDLVITCYKPSKELTDKLAITNSLKDSVWDFITEHLAHLPVHIERGNATTSVVERSPKILYDRLISYYVQHGYQIPMDAQEFQAGLREHFIERDGMYFTAPQAAEYEEKRKHTSEFVPMGLIVSDEANGIEWLKMLLKEPKTYQEISPEWMQAVNGLKKGDVLPELKDILEENFIEDETGHWHVPDLEKQIDLEKLKHKSLMKEFNLYKEMAQKPRARIKEVRVEALREGFKQCFKDKDFATILLLGDKIPQNILTEDEQLLQYYDIAQMRA